MSGYAWCPACGRDLTQQDFDDGYCPGCGEHLAQVEETAWEEPAADGTAGTAEGAGAGRPEEVVWKLDGDWVVCPRCGASYDAARPPESCERCVPDGGKSSLVFVYPQETMHGSSSPLVLRHLGTGDEITCSEAQTVLGRAVTPCLADKPFVGRRHARIVRRTDGTYCAQDLGSVNGTRVNGKVVPIGTDMELVHGDVLELDLESFVVQL